MSDVSADSHCLIAELDDAVRAHMDWTRRIIRCAVPLPLARDADAVDPNAHALCRINDTYGHLVGDQVLRRLCGTLQSALRGNEPLYRAGGDEAFDSVLRRADAALDEGRRSGRNTFAFAED